VGEVIGDIVTRSCERV